MLAWANASGSLKKPNFTKLQWNVTLLGAFLWEEKTHFNCITSLPQFTLVICFLTFRKHHEWSLEFGILLMSYYYGQHTRAQSHAHKQIILKNIYSHERLVFSEGAHLVVSSIPMYRPDCRASLWAKKLHVCRGYVKMIRDQQQP